VILAGERDPSGTTAGVKVFLESAGQSRLPMMGHLLKSIDISHDGFDL